MCGWDHRKPRSCGAAATQWHRVDNEQAPVLELDRHHLQRDRYPLCTEDPDGLAAEAAHSVGREDAADKRERHHQQVGLERRGLKPEVPVERDRPLVRGVDDDRSNRQLL